MPPGERTTPKSPPAHTPPASDRKPGEVASTSPPPAPLPKEEEEGPGAGKRKPVARAVPQIRLVEDVGWKAQKMNPNLRSYCSAGGCSMDLPVRNRTANPDVPGGFFCFQCAREYREVRAGGSQARED